MTVEDFLTFVAGAAPGNGDVSERATAWLKKQGITVPVDRLAPKEVTRLTTAAQNVILGRKERDKRAFPHAQEIGPVPPDEPA